MLLRRNILTVTSVYRAAGKNLTGFANISSLKLFCLVKIFKIGSLHTAKQM